MTRIDANGRAYVQGWFRSRCYSCVSRVAEYNRSIIMANQEHLDKLLDSDFGDHWNEWRRENPKIVPDLSGAHLSGRSFHDTNLTGADLRRVDLSRSHLYHVDLSGANAHGLIAKEANFFECNLDGCQLSPRARYREHVQPNEVLIEPYTVRPARLVSVPHDHCADFSEASFIKSSLRQAVLDMARLWDVSFFETPMNSASFVGATFHPKQIHGSSLAHANFADANLGGANLSGVDLTDANLEHAVLVDANLGPARVVAMHNLTTGGGRPTTVDFYEHPEWPTILRRANLRGAYLHNSSLVQADLRGADLRGAHVFGVSAWNVRLEGAIQEDLIVTHPKEPALVVEGIELAQFMHLMLNNERLRQVIDTITSKVVLILGNFSPERKAILGRMREQLRNRGYVPVLFDFEKPQSRDLTETVDLLAGMARFVLADVSEPRSTPHELRGIAAHVRSVPIVPLCRRDERPYAMLDDLCAYRHVLPTVMYDDSDDLMSRFDIDVIGAAEDRLAELRPH